MMEENVQVGRNYTLKYWEERERRVGNLLSDGLEFRKFFVLFM